MNIIEKAWHEFKSNLKEEITEDKIIMMKVAFYSGVANMIVILQDMEESEDCLAVMQSIVDECNEFLGRVNAAREKGEEV